MPLTELLAGVPARLPWRFQAGEGRAPVTGLSEDSRQVRPGFLFAAIPGTRVNGEDYIAAACEAGAGVVVCREEALSRRPAHGRDVCYLVTPHPRAMLAYLAAAYYQPQPPVMVAVTGTDGKTSTAAFIRQLWQLSGARAVSVGTLGLQLEEPEEASLAPLPRLSGHTSPDPVALHAALAQVAARGVTHGVFEASSHGLDQCRLEGTAPQTAVFTSFSPEHLDYHGTMEAYFAAKQRLFTELLPEGDGTAILCSDYPAIRGLTDVLAARRVQTLTYGREGGLRLEHCVPMRDGQELLLMHDGERYSLSLPLMGRFQAYNVMAALLAVSVTTHTHLAALLPLCQQLRPIPGRLEQVATTPAGALAVVDYAHTQAALERVLQTLRGYTGGRLHVVFGCGGQRDPAKRPAMGAVAARLADAVVITDDNPRHEDPARIRAEIRAGCPKAREVPNRGEAIAAALETAGMGDVVLIAGKGHEATQIIGDEAHTSHDATLVRAWLAAQQAGSSDDRG